MCLLADFKLRGVRLSFCWPAKELKEQVTSCCPGCTPTGPPISQPCTWSLGAGNVWWPSQVSGFCRQHLWSCQAKDLYYLGLTPPPPTSGTSSLPHHQSLIGFCLSFSCNIFHRQRLLCCLAIMLSVFHPIFKRATKTSRKEPESCGLDETLGNTL